MSQSKPTTRVSNPHCDFSPEGVPLEHTDRAHTLTVKHPDRDETFTVHCSATGITIESERLLASIDLRALLLIADGAQNASDAYFRD